MFKWLIRPIQYSPNFPVIRYTYMYLYLFHPSFSGMSRGLYICQVLHSVPYTQHSLPQSCDTSLFFLTAGGTSCDISTDSTFGPGGSFKSTSFANFNSEPSNDGCFSESLHVIQIVHVHVRVTIITRHCVLLTCHIFDTGFQTSSSDS